MQYTVSIDQVRAMEWGLSLPQAMLFDYLTRLSTWAKATTLDGQTFFCFRRTKLAAELPLVSESPATFKRHIKGLSDAGLIEVRHIDTTPYVRVTAKGAQWNHLVHPGAELRTPAQNCAARAESRQDSAQNCATISTTNYQDDDASEPPRVGIVAPVPGEQDLPPWVPVGTWREFYHHRAVIRKPLSIPGQRQVVKRLTELRGQGADIGASLEQTMAAGLAIPVTPRDPDLPGESHGNRSPSRKLSSVERVQANIARRRATESGGSAGSHLDADGLPVRAFVDQPVRRPA